MKKTLITTIATCIIALAFALSLRANYEKQDTRVSGHYEICTIRAGDPYPHSGAMISHTPNIAVYVIAPRTPGGGSPVTVTATVDGNSYTATIPATTDGTSKYIFHGPVGLSVYNWTFECRATRVPNPTDLTVYGAVEGAY